MGEATLEDFGREICASLMAERAVGDDPGVRHGHDGGGDVLAASFAADSVVADSGFGELPHVTSIGEEKEKICTRSWA